MKRVVTTLSVCCVKRTCQQRLLGKWLCQLINWIGGNIICKMMKKLWNIKCSGFKWVNNFFRGGGALAPSALSCVRPWRPMTTSVHGKCRDTFYYKSTNQVLHEQSNVLLHNILLLIITRRLPVAKANRVEWPNATTPTLQPQKFFGRAGP